MKVKIDALPQEFIRAIPVMKKIQTAGFDAYFVGGSVRDLLLGTPIHDIDIATSAFPEEIKAIFKQTIDVGIEHGTVLVLFQGDDYEITTFRTESAYQDYRRPDEVFFVRSLYEDLKRRDFTINALALSTSGELIDLFSGQTDLKQRLIKAVGVAEERFNEDALRMMRAVRFASQLDFEIEAKTMVAIKELSHLLQHISVERIQIEFVKMMQGVNRHKGLHYFLESDLFDYCPGFRGQKEHLAKLLAVPNNQLLSETLIWALVCEMLALNEKEISRFLKQWKLPNKLIQTVKQVIKAFRFRKTNDWQAEKLYQLSYEEVELTEDLLVMMRISTNKQENLARFEQLPIHSLKELKLTGSDIMTIKEKSAGPWLGKALKVLEQAVLRREIDNEKDALASFIKEWEEL